jgi:ferredoxin-fold anticodon binding domain-containing protein
MKITNDLSYFQEAEMRRSRLEKLENEVQDLRAFQQRALVKEELMNKVELYKVIRIIQFLPTSRHWGVQDHRSEAFGSTYKDQVQDKAETEAKLIRNHLAHPLDPSHAFASLMKNQPSN